MGYFTNFFLSCSGFLLDVKICFDLCFSACIRNLEADFRRILKTELFKCLSILFEIRFSEVVKLSVAFTACSWTDFFSACCSELLTVSAWLVVLRCRCCGFGNQIHCTEKLPRDWCCWMYTSAGCAPKCLCMSLGFGVIYVLL